MIKYKIPTFNDLAEYARRSNIERIKGRYACTKSIPLENGVSFIWNTSRGNVEYRSRPNSDQNERICNSFEIKKIPNTDHSWVKVVCLECHGNEYKYVSFIVIFEEELPVSICDGANAADMVLFEDHLIIWGNYPIRIIDLMTNEIRSYNSENYWLPFEFEKVGLKFKYEPNRFGGQSKLTCIDTSTGWTEVYQSGQMRKPSIPKEKYFQGDR